MYPSCSVHILIGEEGRLHSGLIVTYEGRESEGLIARTVATAGGRTTWLTLMSTVRCPASSGRCFAGSLAGNAGAAAGSPRCGAKCSNQYEGVGAVMQSVA